MPCPSHAQIRDRHPAATCLAELGIGGEHYSPASILPPSFPFFSYFLEIFHFVLTGRRTFGKDGPASPSGDSQKRELLTPTPI